LLLRAAGEGEEHGCKLQPTPPGAQVGLPAP
jgi:hypothetical protein